MAQVHFAHRGAAWPPFAPQTQFVQLQAGAFNLNFHPSIVEVAHPAAQPQFGGTPAAGAAEANPLHIPFHHQPPAFVQLNRLGFLSGDEATAVLPVAASTAARHRHEIVQHPPQWRWTQLA